jgi:hypothetical protein
MKAIFANINAASTVFDGQWRPGTDRSGLTEPSVTSTNPGS